MHLGIKLDVGFEGSELYRELYGARDTLSYLRGLGVEAVETPIGPETDELAGRRHLRLCRDHGLRVSLHPYTEGTPYNPWRFAAGDDNACRALHLRFFELGASSVQDDGEPVIVNIHAVAAPVGSARPGLVERSVEFFAWACEWCLSHAPTVYPVAELQIRPDLQEPIQRIGDTYEELLQVVVGSGVGACWDMGHALMNARRFGLALDPPGDLLGRIAHVHCHDVDEEDHRPLIYDTVPWRRFLGALAVTGYEGTVVLEVTPAGFLAAGGLPTLERSVQALQETGLFSGGRPASRGPD